MKKIKTPLRASPAQKTRSDFLAFFEKAVPLYQKRLLRKPLVVVLAEAKRAREQVENNLRTSEMAFIIDQDLPIESQLADVARAIAAMSFSSKGVTVFGRHWTAHHPEMDTIINTDVYKVDGAEVSKEHFARAASSLAFTPTPPVKVPPSLGAGAALPGRRWAPSAALRRLIERVRSLARRVLMALSRKT